MAKLTEEDKILRIKIISRLKELRESATANQTEFAHELGLDKQLINSWKSLKEFLTVQFFNCSKSNFND